MFLFLFLINKNITNTNKPELEYKQRDNKNASMVSSVPDIDFFRIFELKPILIFSKLSVLSAHGYQPQYLTKDNLDAHSCSSP